MLTKEQLKNVRAGTFVYIAGDSLPDGWYSIDMIDKDNEEIMFRIATLGYPKWVYSKNVWLKEREQLPATAFTLEEIQSYDKG